MILSSPRRVSRGLVLDIWECLMDERVAVHPPAIAFYMLAFGVPFLLVLFSALSYFFPDEAARAAITDFFRIQLPVRLGGTEKTGEIIEHVLGPLAAHRKAMALAGLSVLYLSGAALMQSMRLALNQIFDVPIRRNGFWGHIYAIAAFGFVGSIVFLCAAIVWGLAVIIPYAMPFIHFTDHSAEAATRWATWVVLTASNVGLFYGLYRFLPDEKPSHRTALIASLLCTGLLFVAREVSGRALDRSFDSYNVIYGAYAALALGSLWLYYAAFIFTVCAAFGRTLDENLESKSRST